MFWAAKLGIAATEKAYSEIAYKKSDLDRQIRKQTSRHVIWIAATSITNREIAEQETNLIDRREAEPRDVGRRPHGIASIPLQTCSAVK
jgi:hypothetical protein